MYASAGRQADRHLVIVHRAGWQAVKDWHAIAANVGRIDPGIAIFVVSADAPDPATAHYAASRPTLVFSAGPLGQFAPARGKVYHGRPIAKIEQLRLLAAAGVRVPRTMLLRPDSKLDPALLGEFVIVKPTDIATSSHGLGITLMRTARVRYVAPNDYPEGHPGRLGPMMVQQFVDTGEHIRAYRVLTLFGQPLYSQLSRSTDARVTLSADDAALESGKIAMQAVSADGKEKTWVYEADVIALAAAAYRAIPEAPLQGATSFATPRQARSMCWNSIPAAIPGTSHRTIWPKAGPGTARISNRRGARSWTPSAPPRRYWRSERGGKPSSAWLWRWR